MDRSRPIGLIIISEPETRLNFGFGSRATDWRCVRHFRLLPTPDLALCTALADALGQQTEVATFIRSPSPQERNSARCQAE